jgi:hydroxymethylpyrimidine/phosphomethylpyrimidine kinase
MAKTVGRATVLSIGGSDSGGGAGIQADLKTLMAVGVHGTCAITCLTGQNPKRVLGMEVCRPETLRMQIEAVMEGFEVAAVKTGMIFSEELIGVVGELARRKPNLPLVVDPVMVATSGARLISEGAVKVLCRDLFPLAALITPNLDEAEMMLGRSLREAEGLRKAAADLHDEHGCAVLVKGGHLQGWEEAIDFYYDGETELLLKAPFIRGKGTHGSGCTYASAIAGYLALGCELPHAVQMGKNFITRAIAESYRAGEHDVLNPDWKG